MARTRYHDFLDAARVAFDLSFHDAQRLYGQTRDLLGRTAGVEDLMDLYAVEEEELEPSPYDIGDEFDMDDFFDDVEDWDLYVDEGVEFEITGTTEGGTPRGKK